MKKFLTKILSVLIAVCIALTFAVGCSNTADERDPEIVAVYNSYVSNSKEQGQAYLSYEDWLASIKGEKGDPGKDGAIPYVGDNGNWYIDGEDTGYPSCGQDGKSTTVSINSSGYWVIDGEQTKYKAEGDNEQLMSLLKTYFNVEKGLVLSSETVGNPAWNFTNSTFSGWGGSIGKPNEVEAVSIITRARDIAITKIKFFLTVNDKDGKLLASETLNVNIPAGESKEIIWKLPQKITNNTDPLFLAYNCDQFCDYWSDISVGAEIPSTEYQALNAYSTNGKMHNATSTMSITGRKMSNYMYVKIGTVQDVLTLKNPIVIPEGSTTVTSNKINVFLPDEYDLAVNDNFQLFYRGVVQAVNPYNYDIDVTCTKGKQYPRYFEWTPEEADVGKSYDLTITIRDDNGNELGKDTTKLTVHKPKTTGVAMQNVLCIGDSLTQRGHWTGELYRRFTQTGGAPAGLGLNYLNFIGTQVKPFAPNVGYEGYSGRHWQWFCGEESPFYDSTLQDISFKSYCEKNGYEDIDVVYMLLTWNRQGTPYVTNFDLNAGQFVYATKMIDKIHQEYPNAIIRCMGIQMPSITGGMGYMYGSNGGYSNDYGMIISAMNYNAALEDFCQQAKYKDFVKYVDVAGQFDTEYNMPTSDKPVNNRSEVTEPSGTDGVHPSTAGYYQIADAAFRSLCEIFGI